MASLGDLPAPGPDALEGYFPDPLGSGRARWWDGRAWTTRVGPKVEPGASPDQALTPPDRVCPRCDVGTRTFDANCPHCGRNFSQGSPLRIAAIAAAGAVLGLGGCGALVGAGVYFGDKELEKHAITREQWEAVPNGASQAQVEARFGDALISEEDDGEDCLTYHEQDTSVFNGDFLKLCFRDGKLVSKDSF